MFSFLINKILVIFLQMQIKKLCKLQNLIKNDRVIRQNIFCFNMQDTIHHA